MSITSNLYPPIVNDTSSAFIRTKQCRIYFSLSNYNSLDDIKNVQISIVNQKTNISALKTNLYPSGIKIANILTDKNVFNDYKYYIEINPSSDIEGGVFGLNQFYKVQLRFTSKKASNPPSNGKQLATWLYNNTPYFSQWSTVCLIKGIEQPLISIHGFDDININSETVLTSPIIDVIGKMYYNEIQEKQYLKSYNIKIYQAIDLDTVLFDSGEIYTNQYNPNEFNYELTYDLLDGISYVMALTYTTNNLYTETINYQFTIIQYGVDKLNANIIATPEEENGRIKINIISKDTNPFIGNLTIRRTSSESNFHKWEDVKTITYMTGTELNYTWYDTTIQSGTWYKYCAQKRNSHGDRGAIIQIDNPVMCVLDDIFLTKNNCQLKISFNPSLSEFKYNVSESQQTTIGSKFPYIKRNGNNYFRTFPIGGLISSFIDTSDWYDPHFYDGEFHTNENEIKAFSSKDEIYGEAKNLYDEYNQKRNINEYQDYIYEREFRKKVYDFLYKNDVKLFRSTTEGNILIKLMNIDFQPVETLGRRLYSFTATAVEIDDATIANYNKYNIQVTGEYQSYITYKHEVLGQIQGTYSQEDGNILSNIINTKYYNQSTQGFKNQVNSLSWLKLEIDSDPYVIIEEGGQLIKATTSSNIIAQNATVGHIVQINGKEIIVYTKPQRRTMDTGDDNSNITYTSYFELKEDNTLITDLRFKYPTTVTLNYIANLEEIEDTSNLTSQVYYFRKPGQLYGSFEPKDSLMRRIYGKYLLDYKEYYQKLLDVTDVQIEGPPGAVIYIKDSKDSDFNRHVLENGYLQLKEDNIFIEGLYFCGMHLTECKDPDEITKVNGLTDEDFILQEHVYNDFSEITEPENGHIYQFKSYGLTSGAFVQNHKIVVVNEDDTEHVSVPIKTLYSLILEQIDDYTYGLKYSAYMQDHKTLVLDEDKTAADITFDNLYTLLLDPITDNEKLKFVYYYGTWYLLSESYERTKLLKNDIRQLRDNEYIPVDGYYNSFEEIQNPIPNGVYWVSSFTVEDNEIEYDKTTGLLTISEDSVIKKADENYALIMKKLYEESKNRYIYYHGQWYHFTADHDVLCPIDGIVNYCCEIVKGVY